VDRRRRSRLCGGHRDGLRLRIISWFNIFRPHAGLRSLQARGPIETCAARAPGARPSTPDPKNPAAAAREVGGPLRDELKTRRSGPCVGLDGLIVGNTTIERRPISRSRERTKRAAVWRPADDVFHRLLSGPLPFDGRSHTPYRLRRVKSGAMPMPRSAPARRWCRPFGPRLKGPGIAKAIKRELAQKLAHR